jgi:hypothetical protein
MSSFLSLGDINALLSFLSSVLQENPKNTKLHFYLLELLESRHCYRPIFQHFDEYSHNFVTDIRWWEWGLNFSERLLTNFRNNRKELSENSFVLDANQDDGQEYSGTKTDDDENEVVLLQEILLRRLEFLDHYVQLSLSMGLHQEAVKRFEYFIRIIEETEEESPSESYYDSDFISEWNYLIQEYKARKEMYCGELALVQNSSDKSAFQTAVCHLANSFCMIPIFRDSSPHWLSYLRLSGIGKLLWKLLQRNPDLLSLLQRHVKQQSSQHLPTQDNTSISSPILDNISMVIEKAIHYDTQAVQYPEYGIYLTNIVRLGMWYVRHRFLNVVANWTHILFGRLSQLRGKESEELLSPNEVDAEIFLLVLIWKSLRRIPSSQRNQEDFFDFLKFDAQVTSEEQAFWTSLLFYEQQLVNNHIERLEKRQSQKQSQKLVFFTENPTDLMTSHDFRRFLTNIRRMPGDVLTTFWLAQLFSQRLHLSSPQKSLYERYCVEFYHKAQSLTVYYINVVFPSAQSKRDKIKVLMKKYEKIFEKCESFLKQYEKNISAENQQKFHLSSKPPPNQANVKNNEFTEIPPTSSIQELVITSTNKLRNVSLSPQGKSQAVIISLG